MIASNQTFIIAAYAVSWVVILAYLVRLVHKGGRVRAEYERAVQQQREERQS